jgi:hypothetical protein
VARLPTMERPTPDDMLAAGAVVLAALVAFIAVLYLNRKGGKQARGQRGAAGASDGGGTVLVQEGGRVVRRSTRCARAMNRLQAVLSLYHQPARPDCPATCLRRAMRDFCHRQHKPVGSEEPKSPAPKVRAAGRSQQRCAPLAYAGVCEPSTTLNMHMYYISAALRALSTPTGSNVVTIAALPSRICRVPRAHWLQIMLSILIPPFALADSTRWGRYDG